MKYGHWLVLGTLAFAMTAPLAGCGDNDNTEVFTTCGDGVVNNGEQCDDGNSVDTDACLTSCLDARCGDGFIQTGEEDCDGGNLNGASCSSLGEGNGTLTCSGSCAYDTSGCDSAPVPTVTPTPGQGPDPTATPTPVTSGEDPTPTPTSTAVVGPTCGASQAVVVDLTTNIAIGGVQLELSYPGGARIPGTGGDPDVIASASFPPGFLNANDQDTNSDTIDDRVDFAWASSGGTFTDLATVEFECVPGEAIPTAGSFTCTIKSASDDLGQDIQGVTCTVTVQ